MEEYTSFQIGKKYWANTKVIDGDTIEVSIDWKNEKVRMIGIDAPETNQNEWCFWEESGNYLSSLIEWESVYIEIDQSQWERDKYQRLLGYVFLDRENINNTMIEEGYAFEYTYDKPYKYQKTFQDNEKLASSKKLWIWNNESCYQEEEAEIQSSSSYYDPYDQSYLDMWFDCSKRKYCKYMESCDEVKYYFYQCGARTFDRDEDGIPCESVCWDTMK